MEKTELLEQLLLEEQNNSRDVGTIRKIVLANHKTEVDTIQKRQNEQKKKALIEAQRREKERMAKIDRGKKAIKKHTLAIVNGQPHKHDDMHKEEFIDAYQHGARNDSITVSVAELFDGLLTSAADTLPDCQKEPSTFREKLFSEYVNKTPFDIVKSGKGGHTFHFAISLGWKV